MEALLGKGFSISIFDANVNLSKLVGANRSYIEQEIPHISQLMCKDVGEVLERAEVILVANKGGQFKDIMRLIKPGQRVYDLVRIIDDGTTYGGQYEGIGW